MQKKVLLSGIIATVLFANVAVFANPAVTPKKRTQRWGANYFPNIPLITHEGKAVRFFDDLIKDKVVVINFIYTTCPDSCPLETARLLEVQRILGDRVGKDVFMYSISIDPKTDTPEVLKKYTELYGIGPGWLFLTGDEDDIILLRKKFGLYIQEIQNGTLDHNLSLIIGNQTTGRWMKSSPFENPYFLAKQIGSWLHNWKLPSKGDLDYANAPKLRDVTKGETLYRTRCAACHTIGGGDIREVAQRRVGPDLLGVVQMRDRAWLARWIAEPEKMLREKDPIAMGMMAKYNNLPMPNMRLNNYEVDRLIEYMDKEGRRVEKIKKMQAFASKDGGGNTKSCCSLNKDSVVTSEDSENNQEPRPPTVNLGAIPQTQSDRVRISEVQSVKIQDTLEQLVEVQIPENPSAQSQSQRGGFATTSMIMFSILGFVFMLLARVLRQTR